VNTALLQKVGEAAGLLVQLAIGVATIMIMVGIVVLMAFPLVQLVYVIPMIVKARRKGNRGRIKGVIIAACVTLLLCGGCWYQVASGGFRIAG
jgi:hypothetical protein